VEADTDKVFERMARRGRERRRRRRERRESGAHGERGLAGGCCQWRGVAAGISGGRRRLVASVGWW
jgi:hypothetical protein